MITLTENNYLPDYELVASLDTDVLDDIQIHCYKSSTPQGDKAYVLYKNSPVLECSKDDVLKYFERPKEVVLDELERLHRTFRESNETLEASKEEKG